MKQQEFLGKVKEAVTEAVKGARSNPNIQAGQSSVAPSVATVGRKERSTKRVLDRVLDKVDDALSALDEGREDEAADLLDDILDEYDEDDD